MYPDRTEAWGCTAGALVCATDPYLNVTCSSAVLIELPLFDVTCMHLQVIAANFGALLRL